MNKSMINELRATADLLPVRAVRLAFDFALAFSIALLCSYWIVRGRW